MKLSTMLMYAGNPREAADQVVDLEKAGLNTVWVAEPYSKPLGRTREAIEIIRAALRREVIEYSGKSFQLPLPSNEGTGLGKPLKMLTQPERSRVPIYIAALVWGGLYLRDARVRALGGGAR